MQTGPATRQRRASSPRREHLRRRRFAALIVLATLVGLAVWAAYSVPGQTPAAIPENAAAPVIVDASTAATEGVVVARVEDVEVLLPVARKVTTAVAYHPVDNGDAVPFEPSGKCVSGGLRERLADVFASGGDVQYYLASESGAGGSAQAGLDVGAVPGSQVVSPVDGKVIGIKKYRVLGRYNDVEIKIQVSQDPSLVLVVTHMDQVDVTIGDTVARGETVLGAVRGFPAELEQTLSRYTSDNGDHVRLMMLRITPDLAG